MLLNFMQNDNPRGQKFSLEQPAGPNAKCRADPRMLLIANGFPFKRRVSFSIEIKLFAILR
jgi:hypothetical protein